MKEVFDRKSKVLLVTTPPRFGKTINLNTVREYVELQECDDHNFFEGTNIWEYDSYKSHFRKYIVIYISFDGAPTNFKTASSCLQSAVERAYLDHKCLVNSEKLSDSSKLRITRWLNCEVKEEDDIKNGIFHLKTDLKTHHGVDTKFVILVDEFDQVVSNSMFCLEENELEEIMKTRDSILQIIKHDAQDIFFSLLTGVTDITSVTGSLLNNDERYSLLANDHFFTFYGLMENEFENLLQRNPVNDDFYRQMKILYNGYERNGKKLFNTWCVIKALHQNVLEDFFSSHSLITGIIPLIRDLNMDNYMKKIVSEIPIACTDLLNCHIVVE